MKYDLIIIGGGASGFAAAIKASEITENKAKIMFINSGKLGGTCVNVGCIPSKYLLEISHSAFYPFYKSIPGINFKDVKIDFEKIIKEIRKLVNTLRKEKYENVIEKYENVDFIKGEAKFVSSKEVKVNGKKIKGEKFIICTGSRPLIPPIEGLKEAGYIDSDNIWNLNKLPNSVAILGAGAIGLELGQALLHLKSEVKVIEVLDRILPISEPEISKILEKHLTNEGMNFIKKARVVSVSKKANYKILEIVSHKGKMYLEVEEILVATGRKPNTDKLNLEKAKVKTDGKGFIIVDNKMRTSSPNIYAAGDVISKKFMLETLSAKEGTIAAINALGGNSEIDYSYVPNVVFTNPNVASVGFTENEVVEKFGSCSCSVIKEENLVRARMSGFPSFTKMILNPYNNQILGIHCISPFASEFISWGALAIMMKMTFKDFINTMHVFPTYSENLKLVSQSFIREISKMPCCVE